MAFSVDSFRSALVHDGARPNLFEFNLKFPAAIDAGNGLFDFGIGNSQDVRFFCKSAVLPGSSIAAITVPYFGREVKVAGNRTFPEWSVSVINDESFNIRNAFEAWHKAINSNVGNLRSRDAYATTSGGLQSDGYAVDCDVIQYGKDGAAIKAYKFVGLWPNDIGQIDLDWGTNDIIEEFSVSFSYQYWKPTVTNARSSMGYRDVSDIQSIFDL